jgi:hypothetical protein
MRKLLPGNGGGRLRALRSGVLSVQEIKSNLRN